MNQVPDRKHTLRKVPVVIPPAVAERAATKYVEDDDGHWISTYSVASHGYAQIGWKAEETGRMTGTTAHRAAWTHWFGPIPEGMTVDHKEGKCPRPCVHRDHLRLLSNFENARRTFGRDWPEGQCRNGHPNSELIVADGGRRIRCRICNKEQKDRYNAKVRARRNPTQ